MAPAHARESGRPPRGVTACMARPLLVAFCMVLGGCRPLSTAGSRDPLEDAWRQRMWTSGEAPPQTLDGGTPPPGLPTTARSQLLSCPGKDEWLPLVADDCSVFGCGGIVRWSAEDGDLRVDLLSG